MAKELDPAATVAATEATAVAPTASSDNTFSASVNISGNHGLKIVALTAGLGIFGYISIKITNKLTRVRDKKVEISDK